MTMAVTPLHTGDGFSVSGYGLSVLLRTGDGFSVSVHTTTYRLRGFCFTT